MPQGDDLLRVTEKYASMGFPGCVGSTDCVHFFWDRCPHNVRFLHSGKEGKPTVAYSMIVDHMRRIRSVTALAITGIFIGDKLSKKIDGNKLKKGFGWFVLIMGLYIITQQLFFPIGGGH